MEDPNTTLPRTLISHIDPKANNPAADIPEPHRTKPRTENELPNATMFATENSPLILA
jgi:hypothetical protein